MFTGLIQDIGKIEQFQRSGDNALISIHSAKLVDEVKIGDSIAVSGICLTISKIYHRGALMSVTAVTETLSRSTLDTLKRGDHVNLELALKPSDRMGGHFVQGHVDAEGRCLNVQMLDGSWVMTFGYPREHSKLIVEKGSIAIDGVSLTAYDLNSTQFKVSIVPHTWESTTLRNLRSGDQVNLEFDMIGKYILRQTSQNAADKITLDKLAEYGY